MKTRYLGVMAAASCLWIVGCGSPPAGPSAAIATSPAASTPLPTVPAAAAEVASAAVPAPAAASEPQSVLPPSAAKPPAPFDGAGWQALSDGATLSGWRPTEFAGRGEVNCVSGVIVLKMGDPFTGINWTNDFPKMNYEVALDAMRVMGTDFFCGLTVPVGDSFCSLIVGGWGGSLVGISSLDDMDASENQTTKFMTLERGRWYRIRLRVTERRIEAWIDADKVINVVTLDHRISLRPGDIELCKPFGFAAWQTTAALREIKLRRVDGPADPPPKDR